LNPRASWGGGSGAFVCRGRAKGCFRPEMASMPLECLGCIEVVNRSEGAIVTIAGTTCAETEQDSGFSG
jgi:hypothetical protein